MIENSVSQKQIRDHYTQFILDIKARLDKGAREYGDVSFSKDPATLLDEIQAEILDISGWSFVLYRRIEAMKEALGCPRNVDKKE